MQNLFLLPTEKPSRLHYSKVQSEEGISYKLMFNQEESKCNNGLLSGQRHIYITSDEEIKEGDWVYDTFKNACPIIRQLTTEEEVKEFQKTEYKIILTTDQDLIADGVQPIDDEFLEWFVNNPSCEEVQVDKFISGRYFVTNPIIAQEEPKIYPIGGYAPGPYWHKGCVTCKKEFYGDKRAVQCEPCAIKMVETKIVENESEGYEIEKTKQQTLEEAAREYWKKGQFGFEKTADTERAFFKGGLWQAERSYSKEEVLQIYKDYESYVIKTPITEVIEFSKWFEQNKKK